MRRLLLPSLAIVAAGAVVLLGGIALGNALADDDVAGASAPTARPIPAAMPAASDEVPDGTEPPSWPEPSPIQILPADDGPEPSTSAATDEGDDPAGPGPTDDPPIDLSVLYDPETGIDSDATREPFIPPTSPGADPETDEVDPALPPERADGVEELTPEDVAEESAPLPSDEEPRFRFVDPCAGDGPGADGSADEPSDDGDEPCPDGSGGTILLIEEGDPPAPLSIMRQLYTSMNVPLELRCSPLGMDAEGIHRAIFASNNPATFTITYWPSSQRELARTVTFETPESEVDLWLRRRLAGEGTYANMHGGVHNCPALPGLFPCRHTTFDIHGVDEQGTEAEARIYFTPEANSDGVAVGRPEASFTAVDDVRGLIEVPYDERREEVYLASLPRNGARATTDSCTDIENDVLARRHRTDLSIYDWSTTEFPRTEGDGYDPGIDTTAIGRFVAEEGTTYEICVWVTQPPRRSFDKPPVVLRESFEVRSPRHLRTRIWLGGGHSDVPLDVHDLRVRATNWDNRASGSWPIEPTPSGTFFLDDRVLLADSGSVRVPPITVLEITGPEGDTLEATVPTPTECWLGFLMCAEPGVEQYDVQIPGGEVGTGLCGSSFGPCDPPTREVFLGNMRLLVEVYAGPGGPPENHPIRDGWQISDEGAFTPADPERPPAEPRLDENNSSMTVREHADGGRPSVVVSLVFDRLVEVTAVPRVIIGGECPIPAVPQTTAGPTQIVNMQFDDLCWGNMYTLDFVATDAEGDVLDVRGVVDGEPTGRAGWSWFETPRVSIQEYSARVTFNQIGEGFGATSARLRVGFSQIDVIASGAARCIADGEPNELGPVRNAGGRPILLADPVEVTLELRAAGDGRDCGDRYHGEGMRLTAWVPLDQLLAGEPVVLSHTDPDGTDIVVEIHDVVPAG